MVPGFPPTGAAGVVELNPSSAISLLMMVMVAAARDTQVGLVRRLLGQARQRATAWMGAVA